MERSRFPNTLELITGKFLRHSKAFYKWRIKDRLARLEKGESSKELYDDLAVAYDKTGQHDKAIETIDKKETLWPGLYETLANKGTFLIHSGKLEEGSKFIGKAIELNSNAHFGREIYQQRLVEYLLSRQLDGKTILPIGFGKDSPDQQLSCNTTFSEFLEQAAEDNSTSFDRSKAIKGILGMMRFGNYDSPVLLEALGDLLLKQYSPKEDAKWLAARAYLKAAFETKDKPGVSELYRKKATEAIKLHEHAKLEAVEQQLKKELRTAADWWKVVEADEKRWVEASADVDAEFSKKYFKEPVAGEPKTPAAKGQIVAWTLSACVLISAVAFVFSFGSRWNKV